MTISLKNNELIRAWDGIRPDEAADGRMRAAVLERSRRARDGKGKQMKTKSMKKIWIPAAACLTVLIAAAAVFGIAGGFGRNYTVALENGDTVSFGKNAQTTGSADVAFGYEVTSRELTPEELQRLSPLLTEGFAYFRTDTGEAVHFEGKAGETKVILASPGVPVTDTVIDETPEKSTINGVPVSCGYCIANNGGKPVTVVSGEFRLGETTVYTERSAPGINGSAACEALAETILLFIETGAPDLSIVTILFP